MKINVDLGWVERKNYQGNEQAYPLMKADIDISIDEMNYLLEHHKDAHSALMSSICHIGGLITRNAQADT